MDYRALLKKYIGVVGYAEGVDFIPGDEAEAAAHSITPEELAALKQLSEEVNQEWKFGEN